MCVWCVEVPTEQTTVQCTVGAPAATRRTFQSEHTSCNLSVSLLWPCPLVSAVGSFEEVGCRRRPMNCLQRQGREIPAQSGTTRGLLTHTSAAGVASSSVSWRGPDKSLVAPVASQHWHWLVHAVATSGARSTIPHNVHAHTVPCVATRRDRTHPRLSPLAASFSIARGGSPLSQSIRELSGTYSSAEAACGAVGRQRQ